METTAVVDAASKASGALLDLLLRQENIYVMAAVVSLLAALKKVAGKMSNHSLYVRLAPLYPLVLCSAAVWIPGLQPDGMTPGAKILVGFILGGACGWVHKLYTQTIMGKDARIKGMKRRAGDA